MELHNVAHRNNSYQPIAHFDTTCSNTTPKLSKLITNCKLFFCQCPEASVPHIVILVHVLPPMVLYINLLLNPLIHYRLIQVEPDAKKLFLIDHCSSHVLSQSGAYIHSGHYLQNAPSASLTCSMLYMEP